jgi:hypothetical protein
MLKIDWKEVSKSPGYRSLKQAYVNDVQKANQWSFKYGHRPMRDKKEFRGYFKRAMALAMKYSHKWGMDLQIVLNYWEEKRNYWWLNFYQAGIVCHFKPSL